MKQPSLRFNNARSALHRIFIALSFTLLSACSTTNSNQGTDTYDFGVAQTKLNLNGIKKSAIFIADVSSNATFDSNALIYRLPNNPAKPLAYAYARWSTNPATLLTERIKLHAQSENYLLLNTENEAELKLQVELLEFSQVFSSESTSEGVVKLRATLYRSGKIDRQFLVEESTAAVSANAASGAAALQVASEKAIQKILAR